MPPITGDAMGHLLSAEEYYAVARAFERAVRWTQWELMCHAILLLVLPPLAVHFAESRRWAHRGHADGVIAAVDDERFFRTLYTRGACSMGALAVASLHPRVGARRRCLTTPTW